MPSSRLKQSFYWILFGLTVAKMGLNSWVELVSKFVSFYYLSNEFVSTFNFAIVAVLLYLLSALNAYKLMLMWA